MFRGGQKWSREDGSGVLGRRDRKENIFLKSHIYKEMFHSQEKNG